MADAAKVRLAYGETGLDVAFPVGRTVVVEPRFHPGVPDPAAALLEALRRPVAGPSLRERAKGRGKVAISVCDLTRPQPREAMVRAILTELEGIVDLDDIVILNATGTHRGNTPGELEAMLGREILGSVRVENHDARDRSRLTWCGVHGDGVPVWLNSEWIEADLRITTGFVEPHFFAGFSGGPKLCAPGLAGLETVLVLHDAKRIGHPDARWGVCEGNPVHDDIRAVAVGTGVDFAFDVILNRDKDVVAAYAGELLPMHRVAREHSRRLSMQAVPGRADVVVTTNAGYPLDQNLYQAVKGMSAAATVVRPGGLIVCAAECRDGFPDHGSYREVLASASSPGALLADIAARESTTPDQWQVQIQAKVQTMAEVRVYSDYLSPDDLRSAHLGPVDDIAELVAARLAASGPDAWVCVLPEGPQTIPYLADGAGPPKAGGMP
ncbi:nickel-dependent lactate racemase [Intrasporangium mesophilum]